MKKPWVIQDFEGRTVAELGSPNPELWPAIPAAISEDVLVTFEIFKGRIF